jgi:4-hydroxy 2-oxovalerate aldolase
MQQAAAQAGAHTGLVVMAHAADVEADDLARLSRFGVRMLRMPTGPGAAEKLAPLADAVHGAGMAFAVNLTRISELETAQVLDTVTAAQRVGADLFYLADSNGSLFPQQVAALAEKVRAASDLTLGFHAHDGISMAFANALAAMEHGFSHIDASMAGMGKGGGNLALELIIAYLRSNGRLELQITPLAESTPTLLAPWKGARLLAWCESIAGGILDLNLESLESLRSDQLTTVFSLLDGQPSAR